MHETGLMQDLLRRLETLARHESPSARVTRVELRLGALLPASPAHVESHFRQLARGSAAEGAELCISVSADVTDPAAQAIVLDSVEVETAPA